MRERMTLSQESLTGADLQDGDFLWPKKPNSFVPYSQTNVSANEDEEIWRHEKQRFLEQAEGGQTTLTSEQLEAIRAMSYREFLARYHGDQDLAGPELYAAPAGFYVGHVAIVHQVQDDIVVVEALWGMTVMAKPLKDWLR